MRRDGRGFGRGAIVHSSRIQAQVFHVKSVRRGLRSGVGRVLLAEPRAACQITITGVQPGVSNSAAAEPISVQNANVGGDIKNTGSVLQNGITIRDSIVNGTFSNIGSESVEIKTIVGGISADSKSFIGGASSPG